MSAIDFFKCVLLFAVLPMCDAETANVSALMTELLPPKSDKPPKAVGTVNLHEVEASALKLREKAQNFLGPSSFIESKSKSKTTHEQMAEVKIWEILQVRPEFKQRCLGIEDVMLQNSVVDPAVEKAQADGKTTALVVNSEGHDAVDDATVSADSKNQAYLLKNQEATLKAMMDEVQAAVLKNHGDIAPFVMMGWTREDKRPDEGFSQQFQAWCYTQKKADEEHCPRSNGFSGYGEYRACDFPVEVEIHQKENHDYIGTLSMDLTGKAELATAQEIQEELQEKTKPYSTEQMESSGVDNPRQLKPFDQVKQRVGATTGFAEVSDFANIKFFPPNRFSITCVEGKCPKKQDVSIPVKVEIYDISSCPGEGLGNDREPNCGPASAIKLGTDLFDLGSESMAGSKQAELKELIDGPQMAKAKPDDKDTWVRKTTLEEADRESGPMVVLQTLDEVIRQRDPKLDALEDGRADFPVINYEGKDETGNAKFVIWCRDPNCPDFLFLTLQDR